MEKPFRDSKNLIKTPPIGKHPAFKRTLHYHRDDLWSLVEGFIGDHVSDSTLTISARDEGDVFGYILHLFQGSYTLEVSMLFDLGDLDGVRVVTQASNDRVSFKTQTPRIAVTDFEFRSQLKDISEDLQAGLLEILTLQQSKMQAPLTVLRSLVSTG